MKKILYTIALSFVSITAFSQVGVNTSEPQGAFHIDATGTGTDNGSVIVTDGGNTGVGTLTPGEKLEVNGNMQVALTDSVKGNLTVDNKIIVNGTLRLRTSSSDKDLEKLWPLSKFEIIADEPKQGFRFDNGSQIVNDDPTLKEMVPSFGKDPATHLGGWVNLKALTEVKEDTLLNNVIIGNKGGLSLTNITKNGLTLDDGIWLIMASIPTDTNGRQVSTQGLYVYMHLTEDGAVDTTVNGSKAIVGSPTESNGGNANGYGVSTPQLMYMLKVDGTKTYRIKLATSIADAQYRTNTSYGDPFFFAVKLDYTNQ